MKKLFLPLFLFFSIPVCVIAQKVAGNSNENFCNVIKKIQANSVTNFCSDWNSADKTILYDKTGGIVGEGYKTSLLLPGFAYCLIALVDYPYYYAEMENFISEIPALSEIEKIKNRLIACLPNYKLEKNPSDGYHGYFMDFFSVILLNYRFLQKKQGDNKLSGFFLRLEKSKNKGSDIYRISMEALGGGNEKPEEEKTRSATNKTLQIKETNPGPADSSNGKLKSNDSVPDKTQKTHLGVALQNGNSELLASDPLNGKQHYRGSTFQMKKGQAGLFYMASDNFKPRVALLGSSEWIAPINAIETDSLSKVIWIAPTDTSITVYFISAEDNKIGKFSYGFRLMDSSQVVFKDDYSTCDRLTYLINHWQMDWMLVPAEIKTEYRRGKYYAFKNMLLKSSSAEFTDRYEEKMFSIPDAENSKKKAIEFYKKICADIQVCLNTNDWVIETENEVQLEESMSTLLTNLYCAVTTHFIFKGAAKNEHQKSFKVVLNSPFSKNFSSEREYDVLLIFN
jgi:hypothetical protein